MCLNKIDKTVKVRKKEGWQVFREEDGDLYPLFFNAEEEVFTEEWTEAEAANVKTICSDVPMRLLKEKYDKEPLEIEDPDLPYEAGYHIFLRKMDAELYARNFANGVVKKVEFYGVKDKGYFNFMRKVEGEFIVAHTSCVVAKERNILE